jgi:hypothetical protein
MITFSSDKNSFRTYRAIKSEVERIKRVGHINYNTDKESESAKTETTESEPVREVLPA